MFKRSILILAASCMMYSCANQTESNPFLTEFQTPNGVPPFDKIRLEHYEPAFLQGIEEQNANIRAIVDNTEAPDFENVIVAFDNSSPILNRVSAIFFNMTDAETSDALNELSIKLAPVLSEHGDNISLNQALFNKVQAVYQKKDSLNLTTEQQRLLDKTYKDFVRSGANLSAEKQARLREINKQLSTLGITFSNNILNENNEFMLFVDKQEDLAGLPEWFRQSAAEEAKAAGQEGKWLFTLHNASRLPFLQYSANRPLREKIYKAYINRGNNNDKNDNKKIITDIVSLRLEKARLLGFDCYSNFVLDNTMAKNSATVMEFLNNLWNYALPKAKAEAAELQKLMDKEGKGEKLEAGTGGIIPRSSAKKNMTSKRPDQTLLQIGERTRRRFCRCQQTLWHYADKTQQYPCLSSRCRSLRGKRCRRLAIRHLLRRLLPASRQERRSMDEQLPRTERRHPSVGVQRSQLHQTRWRYPLPAHNG